MNFCTLCTILVTFDPETPEFTLLTIAPFVAIWQKSAYHAKYLKMSWTYIDLLYSLVGALVGMIFQIFVWRWPKGHCYSNQLNMGDVRKRDMEWPLFFALTFDNRLAAFKKFNGNNEATICPNLVNFRAVISDITLLKHAFFLPRLARNLTTIFIRHVGVFKRIERS